ncbi:MAG: SCP2 sterol-binding domain-containing protein [Armatimonadetes bacterium]|nr:SCP2 sterol-binding domain-containing protein [Armatimonadota bacterium]
MAETLITPKQAEKVIPISMIPDVASEVVEVDGQRCLQTNEAMFTFYKRTKGEFSQYFLALKERKVILGARCPKCNLVRVPPFQLYCPDCDFAELETVEMSDCGVMNSTPPITYFGHSLFQHLVPFGRGRVMLEGADTALPIHVYTTRGVLTPRVFRRGTPVKVIFRDQREGKPTDVFAVPLAELTPEQQKKPGLQESELDWSSPVEPELPAETSEARTSLSKVLSELKKMAEAVRHSARAQKDLSEWKRRIQVKTGGGSFGLVIDDRSLSVQAGALENPDCVMVSSDPGLFSDWLSLRESLTNAIIAEKLWISKNSEFITVFKLDRVPRSLKRTSPAS